ncbi:hypothetical protein L1280_000099 [Deinococcus sp. HSC-46F16]|uniref:hypothetical protein n=1 Tax=Deinococcus sp. HSC-46F16 TaxID=2910968 RepID=UPI0020A14C1A|nr:hypothetical protein [Deinococcus sp. HSC-46F16]MCP2012971.1 hypothetical protein [Deinococcus sp. HSC-46F16]
MPESRWDVLRGLLGRGLVIGLGVALAAALVGHFLIRPGWEGVRLGLNSAGTLMCVLAGSFVIGAFDSQEATASSRGRLGEGTERMGWPLAALTVSLLAAGVCFGLAWLAVRIPSDV